MDSWWRKLLERLRGRVVLSDYYLGFVLLNLGDLFLTGVYFKLGGHEANRLADWILRTFGLRGLVVFKFALVTMVIAICEALFPRRPLLARVIILAGCAVYALVILLEIRGLVMAALGS